MKTLMIGMTYRVELPYSEVCMHLRVAGEHRYVRVLPGAAQILNDDQTPFSFPITWGEAGIGRDSDGRPVVLGESYPRYVDDPRGIVWACCESSIGPDCPHKTRHGE